MILMNIEAQITLKKKNATDRAKELNNEYCRFQYNLNTMSDHYEASAKAREKTPAWVWNKQSQDQDWQSPTHVEASSLTPQEARDHSSASQHNPSYSVDWSSISDDNIGQAVMEYFKRFGHKPPETSHWTDEV